MPERLKADPQSETRQIHRPLLEEVEARMRLTGVDFLGNLAEEYKTTGPSFLIFYPNTQLAEFSAQCFAAGGFKKYKERYPDSTTQSITSSISMFAIKRLDNFAEFVRGLTEEEIANSLGISRQAISHKLKKTLRDLYENAPTETKTGFNLDEILSARRTITQRAVTFLRSGYSFHEVDQLFGGLSSQSKTNIRKILQKEGEMELSEETYGPKYQTRFRHMKALDKLKDTTDLEVLREGISEFSDSFCKKLRRANNPFFVPLSELVPGTNNYNVKEAALLLEDNGYPIRIIEWYAGQRPQILRYYYVPSPVVETAKSLLHEYFS